MSPVVVRVLLGALGEWRREAVGSRWSAERYEKTAAEHREDQHRAEQAAAEIEAALLEAGETVPAVPDFEDDRPSA